MRILEKRPSPISRLSKRREGFRSGHLYRGNSSRGSGMARSTLTIARRSSRISSKGKVLSPRSHEEQYLPTNQMNQACCARCATCSRSQSNQSPRPSPRSAETSRAWVAGLTLTDIFQTASDIELHVWKQVYLVEEHELASSEDVRILDWLVVALGDVRSAREKD
jgi:hypothetical protein